MEKDIKNNKIFILSNMIISYKKKKENNFPIFI